MYIDHKTSERKKRKAATKYKDSTVEQEFNLKFDT